MASEWDGDPGKWLWFNGIDYGNHSQTTFESTPPAEACWPSQPKSSSSPMFCSALARNRLNYSVCTRTPQPTRRPPPSHPAQTEPCVPASISGQRDITSYPWEICPLDSEQKLPLGTMPHQVSSLDSEQKYLRVWDPPFGGLADSSVSLRSLGANSRSSV